MRGWLVAAVASAIAWSTPALAQRLRVDTVVGATSDAYDLARAGDRVLIATSGGLVILRSGRVEQVLHTRDGLPDDRTRSVSITSAGVWVGTVGDTVLVGFDGELARVVRTVGIARVRRAVEWNGETWFATYGGGVFRLPPGGVARRVPVRGPVSAANVTDLAVAGGSLFASTAGAGVMELNAAGRVVHRYRRAQGLADDLAWCLATDGVHVTVGTIAGTSTIANGHVESSGASSLADVRALALGTSTTWLGTFGAGTFRAHGIRGTPRGIDGGPARVRALLVQGDDVLAASDEGVFEVSRDDRWRALLSGGLPTGDVTSLARAFGALWIGTFDHGLARRSSDGSWMRIPGTDPRVNDLAVTRDHDDHEILWIATDRGLFASDGRAIRSVEDPVLPPNEHLTALAVDPSTGDLWMAGSHLLAQRHDGRIRVWNARDGAPVSQLDTVAVDGRDVWAGGLHGLVHLDPEHGVFAQHPVASGDIPVEWVTAVTTTSDGIAVGTYHGGLAFDRGARFETEREGPGLPSGWVNPHAMREVQGIVFVGTLERGLLYGRARHWSVLTAARGLPSNDVTAILDDGPNAAWIATRAGLARVRWD